MVIIKKGYKMLYQLHHQNRHNLNETKMIEQRECKTHKDKVKFVEELKKSDQPPDGWQWLMVLEESKYFICTKKGGKDENGECDF